MQLSGTQTKFAIVVIVFVIIGLGYFLWRRSAIEEPTIPPGQSLSHPLGEARGSRMTPGGPAGTGGPGAPSGSTSGNGMPVNVPAPGTVDPKVGFGPSKGAPIPGRR
jgi:hypothetical protein